jgi:hypothetical protein
MYSGAHTSIQYKKASGASSISFNFRDAYDLFSSLFFYALKEYDGFSMHSWSLRLFMILLQETAFSPD